MSNYSSISTGIDSGVSSIDSSINSVKGVSFDGVWNGPAHDALTSSLDEAIYNAEKVRADLNRFSEVLTKLERYKKLKEEIEALDKEIDSIVIPADKEGAAAAYNRKKNLIAKRNNLIAQKNLLRKEIESLLSTFRNIESQIEAINFDLNEFKEYMAFIADINELLAKMTPEEREKFLKENPFINLLPKNNSDIAHRGSHPGGIFENSLAAFIEAGEKGFWGCEADVRFDANGNLVCSHNKVTGNQTPTTFEEYLDICKKYGMTAIIDLKYENGLTRNPDTELSPAIIKMIEEKGMLDSCVIQTNHFNDLPYIRSQSEDVRIWLLSHGSVTSDDIQLALENDVECINFKCSTYSTYNETSIKKVTDAGLDACVWNVTTAAEKQGCLNAGATYVMSDNVLGITPYRAGETDFNAVKGNYNFNSNSNSYYETISSSIDTSNSQNIQFYDNYNSATNGTKNVPAGSYDGPILLANQGRLNYTRTDGVTVQESWCDISLKNAPELKAFYEFDGEKVVEGTKIKDMKYWVREDGVQMIGDYVAVATDVIARKSYGVKDNMAGWQGGTYNYGEVVETTLGKGIVMGICTEAQRLRRVNGESFTNLEIYTLWNDPNYSGTVRAKDYVPPNHANDPLLEYQ